MSALASPYFGRAAHSPDEFEPTDAQIAARAAYLKPLLAASKADVAELLATTTGTPAWDAFALALLDGDEREASKLARALMVQAVDEEAERLASNELHHWRGSDRQYEDSQVLRRIRAIEVWSWLREWER